MSPFKSIRFPGAGLLVAGLAAGPLAAADEPTGVGREHAITVYSRLEPGAVDARSFQRQIDNPDYRQQIPGYAVVRTRQTMGLPKGKGSMDFTDVAAGLDPTTVRFESLSDPAGTHVLQQDFLFDLASTNQMLQRYLEQRIEVELLLGDRTEVIAGRLLAARGHDLLLDVEGGGVVSVGGGARNIRFPALADGLLTRPTLRWEVSSQQGGDQDVQVTYETLGMTWWADYTVVQAEADDGACRADLSAWVSLVNQSGGSFEAAKLKLVAGDVNRAQRRRPQPRYAEMRVARAVEADGGFEEQAFFEYHLYTLGRRVDLPDRSLKQLELFTPVLGVPCERTLRVGAGTAGRYYGASPFTNRDYPGSTQDLPVAALLAFDNAEAAGLGVPLPRGRVRVSRRDPVDGALEFIGEDLIDHTPRDERVTLTLGTAFDVVAERSQVEFQWSQAQRWMEETIEVEVRNRKDVPVTVEVDEHLYRWTNWTVKERSHAFEKLDAATIRFPVEVPAGKAVTVRYVARYDW